MRILLTCFFLVCAIFSARAQPQLEVQGGPRSAVRIARVSPDGTRLATLDGKLLQLWTRGGGLLWNRPVSGDSRALAWAPDGKKLAVGLGGDANFFISKPGDSAGAIELDARDGQPLRKLLSGNNAVFGLVYLPDGRLVSQSSEKQIIWDAAGHETPLKFAFGMTVSPSPDKDLVAVTTNGVQLWKPDLSAKIASLWRKGMPAKEFAWAPDGQHFAVANGSHVQLWDASKRAFEREILLPTGAAPTEFDTLALAWTPDSRTVLVARTDFPDYRKVENQEPDAGRPLLFLWRIVHTTGVLTTLRAGERRALAALNFWRDGTLIWGGGTGDPQIWAGDLNFMRLQPRAVHALWRAPQPLQSPRALQISPDGAMLAVSGDDTAIRLWNLKTGRLEKTLKVFSSSIPALSWSPSGRQIAAFDYENLFIFDVASGKARKFAGTPIYYESPSIAWAPDEKQLAFDGGDDATILDLASGKTRELRQKDLVAQMDVAVAGPLRWTNAGLEALGGLELVDPKNGRVLHSLDASGVASETAYRGPVSHFAWFENGRGLLTLGGDNDIGGDGLSVKRWDVATDRVERTLTFDFTPRALALAPDETVFAVGGEGGEIALYDRKTLELRWKLDVGAAIKTLCWSGAGETLFVAAADGWIYIVGSNGKTRGQVAVLPAPKPLSTGYEWIHLASDNRYIASEKAATQVRWRDDGELKKLGAFGAATQNLPLGEVAPTKIAVGLLPKTASENAPPTPQLPEKVAENQLKLVLQGAAVTGQLRDVAVSNGARWVVTHGEDQALTLWDGRERLQWGELTRDRVPLFFSLDGTLLFCAPTTYSGDGEIYKSLEARRIPNGELVRKFALQSPYWSDGKTVRGFKNGAVETYDLSDGRRISTQKITGIPSDNNRLAFSPNGKLLVAGADTKKNRLARVWRVSDGAKIVEIADNKRVIGTVAAVSSDGRFVATEGENSTWKPPTDGPMTESAYAREFQLHLWNARTKKLMFSYPGYYSLSGGVELLRFSPDGNRLFSAGSDGDLRRLDTATGAVADVPAKPKNERGPLGWPIALSPDSASAAGTAGGAALTTVDLATGKLGRNFAGPLSAPDDASWSPDGKYIFGNGLLFNAHTGALVSQAQMYVRDTLWHGDEIWTASPDSVTRWNVPDLKKLDEWQIDTSPNGNTSSGYSNGARFSPDGQKILTADPKGTFGGGKLGLWVWDAQTHQKLRTMIPDFARGSSGLDALVFFPVGDKILRSTLGGMEEWDLNTGEKLREWRDPVDPNYKSTTPFSVALNPLAVSPDGKWIAARANRNDTIWIFDANSEKLPLRLLIKAGYRAQFLEDGRGLLLQNNGQWQLWDAGGDGKTPLQTLGARGNGARLSPDAKMLASFGYPLDGGLQLWDVTANVEAARLYVVRAKWDERADGWIVLTPAGFYNASPAGEARLRWREGGEFWSLGKSRAQFFAPDQVRAALNP